MSCCNNKIKNKRSTTLDFTIQPSSEPVSVGTTGAFFTLVCAEGEKSITRKEAICDNPYHRRITHKKIKKKIPLATFVHITDVHIIDAASPARASFLANYIFLPQLSDVFRPYEPFSLQVEECMVRKINGVKYGPHLGQKFGMVICTGDNADSMAMDELQNYINVLDGSKVVPNPATPGHYFGVQDNYPSENYGAYWHPDPPPPGKSPDMYKTAYGYPEYPGILESAAKPFQATGLTFPWYSCNGNHDKELLGNYSLGLFTIRELFGQLATGKLPEGLGSKMIETMTPVQALSFIKSLELQMAEPAFQTITKAKLRDVPPSKTRLQFTTAEFIAMHFNTKVCPGPVGHGFDLENIINNTLYYKFNVSDKIIGFMLDSCNPSGNLVDTSLAPNGSIGTIQISWLETELRKYHSSYYNNLGQLVKTCNEDKLVMVFAHHTIETMNNIFTSPTTFDNDPQRITGMQFTQILHRYPNVIAFVCGHTHTNEIKFYPDKCGKTQGFWEINTASHIDYPQQSRIIEVGDNCDGTLSIYSTMINHESPIDTDLAIFPNNNTDSCCQTESCDDSNTTDSCNTTNSNSSNLTDSKCCKREYSIAEMASISRNLSFNDPFIVDVFDDAENRTGTPLDRNVELLIYNPLDRCK